MPEGKEKEAEESSEESSDSEQSEESSEHSEESSGESDSKEEQKPAGDKEPESKGKEEERVVPESYDLKLPEDSIVDQAYVQHIAAYAKENKLTQAEAEQTLEAQIKFTEQATEKRTQAWEEAAKADETIGGENFDETVRIANKLLDDHADDGFKKLVRSNGYDKNPGFLRFLSKVGVGLRDDKTVSGGRQAAAKTEESAADMLYPTTKTKKVAS